MAGTDFRTPVTGTAQDPAASERRVPIRRSLIRNLFLLIVLLTGTILLSTVYTARRIAESASKELIGGAVQSVRSELQRFTDPVQRT